jgi:hypothetical protein
VAWAREGRTSLRCARRCRRQSADTHRPLSCERTGVGTCRVAAGWGLNPDKDATYLNVTPSTNDGTGVYRLTVKDVPVDGFWSISVYDAEGHFVKNPLERYSLNSITAEKDADGSVTVQLGGCEDKDANCLPIFPGWNYMVRLYRPRPEVLDGAWTFPEARPEP